MTDSWYYVRDGQQVGPVSRGQLIAELRRSPLWHREPVWQPGYSNWLEAGSIDELLSEMLRPARDVPPPSQHRGGQAPGQVLGQVSGQVSGQAPRHMPVRVVALIYAGLAMLGVVGALIYRWLF
jgi:hypothetical protein